MIGRSPGPGCANEGWVLRMSATPVRQATARDAGIARRALLGLSPRFIRIPADSCSLRRKLGTRAAGVNARGFTFRWPHGREQRAADCGASEAANRLTRQGKRPEAKRKG